MKIRDWFPINDLRLNRELIEVTTLGDTERKYLPMPNYEMTLTTGTWTGTNTIGTTAPTFYYNSYGTPMVDPLFKPATWEGVPKKKSNDPMDWLHSRVDEVCELGYLSD